MDLLPPFYKESYEVTLIQNGLETEVVKIAAAQEDLINQIFVNTATWGLDYWERYLGLEVNLNKPYEFRRSRIMSKLRGKGTTTVKMIKNVAESFSNGEVEIIENNSNYSFTVKFVGTKGIPPNMEDLKSAIEEIKPAHLAYQFEYTYLTWDEFDNYNKTWDEWDSLNLTWDELEVYTP